MGMTMDAEPTRSERFHLPDGSRSVRSPWVWRGMFFMSLIALGLCISFADTGKTFYAGAWGLITVGWFGLSMWLWRRHIHDDNEAWRQSLSDEEAD
jgi:hypothetical protein